ncbi:hypothetical protein [Streptomyces sp. NPDC097619]|uniref:hypothetical protein n=1 Tax=Streptomyces sp. NPDC097619 TaxID=3157228 RepID=UPI00332FFA61
MSGHRVVRVTGGDPDHLELAALTAALFVLAGRLRLHEVRRARPAARPAGLGWTRSRPGPAHPAQSWQAHATHRPFG